jgi:hypothetical protein
MRVHRNLTGGAAAVFLVATTLMPTSAGAISVEVAKKCNVLLAKQFPPRELGNPAAGSAKGNGQAERDYFRKCVDNGGNMDSASDKNTK